MRIPIAILGIVIIVGAAAGQTQDMPGMQMPGMQMPGMTAMNGAETLLMSQASGTSMNPRSRPMPMRMISALGWSLMFMGTAFLV